MKQDNKEPAQDEMKIEEKIDSAQSDDQDVGKTSDSDQNSSDDKGDGQSESSDKEKEPEEDQEDEEDEEQVSKENSKKPAPASPEKEKLPESKQDSKKIKHKMIKVKCHVNMTLHSGHQLTKGESTDLPEPVFEKAIKDKRKIISKA